MNYFHQHPQYMVAGTGVFADWPASQPPNDNYFQMKNQDCQQTFYRGAFNIGGDNRSWNTGVNGYACNQDPQF